MIASPIPYAILDLDSLTAAMAVAPGVYARNRMFALYKEPVVREARARASTIRGAVRQLASARLDASAVTLVRGPGGCVLCYRIESLRLERRIDLTDVEAACLAYLAARAGVRAITATDSDRALLQGALAKLALGLELESSTG